MLLPIPSFLARLQLLLTGCLAFVCLGACMDRGQGKAKADGVLLVVLDGLRADHVGALGGPRPTTPTLDRLVAEGLAFSDAIAAAPLLEPAHIGILTGTSPELSRQFYSHESGAARWQIKQRLPHLAVEFLSAGYQTAAFLDESTLAASEGFARGFQNFLPLDEDFDSAARIGHHAQRLEEWLQSLESGAPWFAYLELSDLDRSWTDPLQPWDSYFSPSKGDRMFQVPPVSTTDFSFFAIPHSRWRGGSRSLGEYVASYDGHLRRLDQELGSIFARLRNLGLEQSTTLVVVGSYGMQFGEAGLYLSAGLLSMADLHVPWIMRPRQGSQQAPAGTQVDAVVSLLDLAPTLLEMEGLPVPAGMHGRSMAAYLGPHPPAQHPRREAYASNGLIDGYVMVGERYALEAYRPGEILNRMQRVSWNGEDQLDPDAHTIRYYDRVKTPFPKLKPYQRQPGQRHRDFIERFQRSEERAGHVFMSRGVLQRSGLWGKPVEDSTVEELVRLGYLGPAR